MTTFGQLSNSRQNHFDLLRLLLALGVLYSHAYGLSGQSRDVIGRLTGGQLVASNFALFGFFLISGYLISGSYLRSRSLKDFALRRARRIMPGFIVAVLLCFCIAGPLGCDSIKAYFTDRTSWKFLKVILMLGDQGVPLAFQSNPYPCNMNGSLWTIRIEVACYAMTVIAGLIGLLRNRIAAALTTAAVVFLSIKFGHSKMPLFFWGVLAMSVPYAIGATAYVWRSAIPASRWLLAAAATALVVTSITGGLYYAVWIAGAYLLLSGGLSPGAPAFLTRIGDLSYGVYLYAFPIQQLVIRWMHNPGPATVMLVGVPITMVLAWISWHLIERPFLQTHTDRPTLDSVSLPALLEQHRAVAN